MGKNKVTEKADTEVVTRKGDGKSSRGADRSDNVSMAIEVSLSNETPVVVEDNSSFSDCLGNKDAVITLTNETIESLSPLRSSSGYVAKRLTVAGVEDEHIVDSDGSIMSSFISLIENVSSIRTLVFTGHVFEHLILPAHLPENITSLIFDDCTINEMDMEEDACPSVDTLVMQKITGLDSLEFPNFALHHVTHLKLARCTMTRVVIDANTMSEGEVLDISGCRNLEEVELGADCFVAGVGINMSRNPSLTKLTLGERSFQRGKNLCITLPELRVLEMAGENFTEAREADVSLLPSLIELTMGAGCFAKAGSFIGEDLGKLRVLDFGDMSFSGASKIFLSNASNLRTLRFGRKCFSRVVEEEFSLCDLPKLEELTLCDGCLGKLDRFILLTNQNLKTLRVGKGALKSCELFVLLSYLNRVHIEMDKEKTMFIPEEYPGLPQEAEISCSPFSIKIEACPHLASITFEKGAFEQMKHCEMSFLKKLKKIDIPQGFMPEAETVVITDNAKLTHLLFPEDSFSRCKYMSIQDLPELNSIEIEGNVMCQGGFVIMRNLYPTTISVSSRSLLCDSASYKSIPNKLRKSCVKNLSKFQAKIASDAFLGQTLVGSISITGVVAIIIILLV